MKKYTQRADGVKTGAYKGYSGQHLVIFFLKGLKNYSI